MLVSLEEAARVRVRVTLAGNSILLFCPICSHNLFLNYLSTKRFLRQNGHNTAIMARERWIIMIAKVLWGVLVIRFSFSNLAF